MPVTFRLNGRVVTLEESEFRGLVRQIIQQTRQYVWLMPRLRFDGHYRNWAYHNRGHSWNVFALVVETVGGARLPDARVANTLKRKRDQLDRMMTASRIIQFYQQFPGWLRASSMFCRNMATYQDRMISGTTQTVRALEITRDASFVTLQVCATILSGGTAAGFTVGGSAAAGALVRAAAVNYVVRETQNASTRLGRTLAGNPPTAQQSAEEAYNAAIGSVNDAAVGTIMGAIMGPLTNSVSAGASREIARGNIAAGVAMEVANDRLSAMVQSIIEDFSRRNVAVIRELLRNARTTSNNNQTAQAVSDGLLRNRAFRAYMSDRIERGR